MSGDAAPRLEVLRGWGMANHARSLVYRPRTAEDAAAAVEDVRRRGLTLAHRGGGISYGDAALNEGGAVLDASRLGRILTLDRERGVVRVEAGVTFEELWTETLPLGWWPPVVPGTMKVTLGGAVAMNVHGKNHLRAGSVGDHVEAVTVLGPDGEVRTLEGEEVRSVVGAQGTAGTILDLTLRLHRVHAGFLDVEAVVTRSVEETVEAVGSGAVSHPYSVAWIDCMARGEAAGRGIVHFADYLPPDHPRSGEAMSAGEQALPGRILGVVPRAWAWMGLKAFFHDPGMRGLNVGRFAAGRLRHGHHYLQPHANFHFLLDYVPGWKRVYAPHGLIQYQLFVPEERAAFAFREALRLQRELGVYSYLGVVKRHRADPSPWTYLVDGYSLALDFPVRPGRLAALRALCRSYDVLLAEVGGRVYAAKDAVGVGRLPPGRDPLYSSNLVRRWERAGGG